MYLFKKTFVVVVVVKRKIYTLNACTLVVYVYVRQYARKPYNRIYRWRAMDY